MSETNELPVPPPEDEESALVSARLEESREWVINTYRKHQRIRRCIAMRANDHFVIVFLLTFSTLDLTH